MICFQIFVYNVYNSASKHYLLPSYANCSVLLVQVQAPDWAGVLRVAGGSEGAGRGSCRPTLTIFRISSFMFQKIDEFA